jgi:hypothetical protein
MFSVAHTPPTLAFSSRMRRGEEGARRQWVWA